MLFKFLHFFTPLLHPIGLIWAGCLAGAALLAWKKKRAAAVSLACVAAVISILASGLSGALFGKLEEPYRRDSMESVPTCDAIILLGGGIVPSDADPLAFTFTDAGNRILTAVELARMGRAPVLVLGGGSYDRDGKTMSDTDLVQRWIQHWQLVTNEILSAGITYNTRDEAVKVKAMAGERGWKRVILVTSAFHMRRTEAVFRTAGLEVVPVACDFKKVGRPKPEFSFNPFPRPEGIGALYYFIHEKVGWVMYRARGWISAEAAAMPPGGGA